MTCKFSYQMLFLKILVKFKVSPIKFLSSLISLSSLRSLCFPLISASPPIFSFSIWSISSCEDAWYADLFPRHFLHHHLYKCHCSNHLADDRCSKLSQLKITIGFLFIHAFVINGAFSPTDPMPWLFFQLQNEYLFLFLLLFFLLFLLLCPCDNLLNPSSVHYKKIIIRSIQAELNAVCQLLAFQKRTLLMPWFVQRVNIALLCKLPKEFRFKQRRIKLQGRIYEEGSQFLSF